jgi:3',5'-nucleoside bisphosphate phosphatase
MSPAGAAARGSVVNSFRGYRLENVHPLRNRRSAVIDLHTHTLESDGTLEPEAVVDAAVAMGLEALAITDHDTFAGYDRALPAARAASLDLVCGIELSTRFGGKRRSVHILGYFLDGEPGEEFRSWLEQIQRRRRERNERLAARLREFDIDVHLEEVEQLGRSIAGRPHFARVMVQKGYVSRFQDAFDRYLGESARAYVARQEPAFDDLTRRVREAGGIASLAHPVRLGVRDPGALARMVGEMRGLGLSGIEVYHSDHSAAQVREYLGLAQRYGLAVTGGTDFHGANKPGCEIGSGISGNVEVPRAVLDTLRALRSGRPA